MTKPPFKNGDLANYYGSTVRILQTNRHTAYVQQGRDRFSVDYRLLSRISPGTT